MDEQFFDKSNFEMLYNLIDDHIIKTNQTTLDSLHINARALIFNSMETKFQLRTKDMSLEDINKMVLRDCVPQFAKHVPKVPVADEQVNVFINPEKSNNDPVNPYKEDLEGTVLDIKKEQQPETSNIHRDLDISSSDRIEWSSNSYGVSDEFEDHSILSELLISKSLCIFEVSGCCSFSIFRRVPSRSSLY